MKLSATRVKMLTKPGMHADGLGLYLNVKRSGSRSWIYRAMVDGRRREIGLGPYPAISLARARERAATHRTTVAEGGNPTAEKQKVLTFRAASLIVHEQNTKRWRPTHARQWLQSLSRHVFPVLGEKRLDQIGREDVLSVLDPIWITHSETARRVRQRIRMVLKYGQAHGYVETNFAGKRLTAHCLPCPNSPVATIGHCAIKTCPKHYSGSETAEILLLQNSASSFWF